MHRQAGDHDLVRFECTVDYIADCTAVEGVGAYQPAAAEDMGDAQGSSAVEDAEVAAVVVGGHHSPASVLGNSHLS